jgi:diguanylate cyclase (GGDEF)-like protein
MIDRLNGPRERGLPDGLRGDTEQSRLGSVRGDVKVQGAGKDVSRNSALAVERAPSEVALERAAAAADRAEAQRLRDEAAAMLALATADELTGAWSRRFGLDETERTLIRARRERTPLVLTFIDVDNLKQVNDLHGHQAGDELLALIGHVVLAHLRPYDIVVRYGGDEFVCATPNMSAAQARARFDQIAAVLTQLDPAHSISFGVAEAEPGENLQRLIIRADTDLLQARESRRTT